MAARKSRKPARTSPQPGQSTDNTDSPIQPPRPSNRWIIYRAAQSEAAAKENPDMSQGELSKIISAKWNAESQEVKDRYEAEALRLKKQHALDHPNYKFQPKSKEQKKRATKEKRRAKAESKQGAGMYATHEKALEAAKTAAERDTLLQKGKGKARVFAISNEPSSSSSTHTLGLSSHHATMPQLYHVNPLLGPSYPIPTASSSAPGHYAQPLHDVHNTHFNNSMQHQTPSINPHHSLGMSMVPQLSGMGSYMSPPAQYEHQMPVHQYNSDHDSSLGSSSAMAPEHATHGGSQSSPAGDEYPVEEEPLSPSIQYLSFDYRNSQKSLDDVPLEDLDIPYRNPTHYDAFTLNSTESANHFTNGLTSPTPSLSQFGNPNLNPSRNAASFTNWDSNLNAGHGSSMRDLHTQNARFDSSNIFDHATFNPSPVPQAYDAAPVASGSESAPMATNHSATSSALPLYHFVNPTSTPSTSALPSDFNAGSSMGVANNAGIDSSNIFDNATFDPSSVPRSYDAAAVASGSGSASMAVQESFVDLLADAMGMGGTEYEAHLRNFGVPSAY